jgi:hypothetical protein
METIEIISDRKYSNYEQRFMIDHLMGVGIFRIKHTKNTVEWLDKSGRVIAFRNTKWDTSAFNYFLYQPYHPGKYECHYKTKSGLTYHILQFIDEDSFDNTINRMDEIFKNKAFVGLDETRIQELYYNIKTNERIQLWKKMI